MHCWGTDVRDWILIVAALALFAALEALFYAAQHSSDRRHAELRRRLQGVGKSGTTGVDLLRRARIASNPHVEAFVRKLPLVAAAEAFLERAGTSWTVARLYFTAAGMALAAMALGILLGLGLGAPLLAAAFGATPFLYLRVVADRRSRLLSEQLPDALDAMSRSLRAGHAISYAFQVVANEMPPPISIEFGRAFEEQRLGISADAAVQQMAGRVPDNGDFQIFAVSITIQRDTGGNLAEILGNISMTIRERFKFQGKLRALTAEARGSTVVLASLPVGVAGLVSVLNPNYLTPLASTPKGHAILIYAAVSWLVGLAWLKKMSKIDY